MNVTSSSRISARKARQGRTTINTFCFCLAAIILYSCSVCITLWMNHQSQTSSKKKVKESPTPRYHQLPPWEIPLNQQHITTAYMDATVVKRAPWFQPKKICTETCCAYTVAVSLHQDDIRIKNTLDGFDLADVFVKSKVKGDPMHLRFFATNITQDILPCFQPGTIVYVGNIWAYLSTWFHKHRPNVTIPYLLLTAMTDFISPNKGFRDKLSNNTKKQDQQLLKWYGTNPDFHNVPQKGKFIPFPLGLSGRIKQQPFLTHYLQQTNFTNPFAGRANKERWLHSTKLRYASETTNILFVKFGVNKNSQHRNEPFAMACNHLLQHKNATEPITQVSCNLNKTSIAETYTAASQYLFGLSPPGVGMDCYRTYELWLLGVIPVVLRHDVSYDIMFPNDLPLIQLHHWNYTQKELIQILQDYVYSENFINNDFSGWERLFLRYWRRKVLKDTGRDKDIVKDENGREYYQAWRYYKKNSISSAIEVSNETVKK